MKQAMLEDKRRERAMSNELTAYGAVELGKDQFELIASESKLVKWAEESQFAVQAINKNTMLQQCAPQSIQESITNVAAIGLSLNPAFGYAYLVPESIKAGNQWVKVCQLRVSFKGLVKIATDSGAIKFVRAEIVRENDSFTYNGPMAAPLHQMNPFGDRGNVIGVYCIAKTADYEYLTDVMSMAEIDKIRKAAKQDGVWSNWFEEMAKKALVKRASKLWPMGTGADRFNQAVQVVNDVEGNEIKDITPEKPGAPKIEQKPAISQEGLELAASKIKSGELTIDRLLEARELTPEQIEYVQAMAQGFDCK